MKKYRVMIADDHAVLRRGLRTIIEAEPLMEVVAEAENGEIALREVEYHNPDAAILDLDMPVLDGLETARQLRRQKNPVEIVFLTIHKEEALLDAVLELGIKGYILKDSAVTEIVGCLRAVAAGRRFLSPALTDLLVNRQMRAAEFAAKIPLITNLTKTERRILRLIAESKTSREIADALFVSPRTVENHRANITAKLNIRGTHALLTFALAHKNEI